MGTETELMAEDLENGMLIQVKLNNPQMGTETFVIGVSEMSLISVCC